MADGFSRSSSEAARKRALETCRAILIRPALRDWGMRGSESFAHSGWGCCRRGERVLVDRGFSEILAVFGSAAPGFLRGMLYNFGPCWGKLLERY